MGTTRRLVPSLRILAAMATFCLLTASFTACGGGSSEGPPAEQATAPPPAPSEAPEPSPEPESSEPEKLQNTLTWSTASEVDNFGYDVYRADQEEGPFERLTEEPIAGAGTTDEPSFYEWSDDTIEPETAYWYFVESVSIQGEREKFTPVFKSEAKPALEPAG